MNSGRANFDGHGGVESSNGHLEWLETDVFVGENAKLSFTYADGDATGQVVFIGAEPDVTLGLLEDVVKNGIVSVVIHSSGR